VRLGPILQCYRMASPQVLHGIVGRLSNVSPQIVTAREGVKNRPKGGKLRNTKTRISKLNSSFPRSACPSVRRGRALGNQGTERERDYWIPQHERRGDGRLRLELIVIAWPTSLSKTPLGHGKQVSAPNRNKIHRGLRESSALHYEGS